MTKQLVRIGMAVMTTLLAVVVLWQFRIAVVYVLISLTLAAALRPLVNRLVGRRFVVRMAWILLYLVTLGGFVFVLFLSSDTAIKEIQELSRTVSVQDQWILPVWLEGSPFQHALLGRLPPPSKLFEAISGNQGQLVLPMLLGFTQGIGGIVSGVFVILFLSIYWSINQIHFERLWLSLLPSGQRKQARGIWRTIEPDIGIYIRHQVIQSIMVGLLLGFGYWLIGSPYPVFLALVGALLCLIPVIGSILAVIPPLLVGLLTSAQLSLFTALYALVVLIGMVIWIKPRFFKRKWDNSILTIVLLIGLANTLGLVGLLVAPPISVVCQILWSRLVVRRAVAGAATQVSDLKERETLLWEYIKNMKEPHPTLVTSSMERLTQLIEKAEPVLAALPVEPSETVHTPQPAAAEDGLPLPI